MNKLYMYLAYAGTIPFLAGAASLWFGVTAWPLLGAVEHMLGVYGLIIATFLAGSHWGQHLYIIGIWQRVLPIISNMMAIMLWLSFIMLNFSMMIIILIATFSILLYIDYALSGHNFIETPYMRTRYYVTGIVMASLIIAGLAVWPI